MSKIREIDELNTIENARSIPYEQYFGEMELGEDEREQRIELARQLEAVFLLIFALIVNMHYEEKRAISFLKEKYRDTITNFSKLDPYLENYIDGISENIVGVTVKNNTDGYFTSYDRAVFIAENEANTCMNYLEFTEAIQNGKTMKQWIDIRDKRERGTHREVGGTAIPILEPFSVGKSLMMYPKDSSLGAEADEIVNCRCSIKYL